MNLSAIPLAPHVLGYIKVACENDPAFGESRTRDEFLVTARHHSQPGEGQQPALARHPIREQLATADEAAGEPRIKEIPVRLFFNKAANALSINYQAYASQGNMPVCSGDGKNARRLTQAADHTPTMQDVPCPGPDLCAFVQQGHAVCRRQVRMAVQITKQKDPLGVFEMRTSSLNTYRALRGQLRLLEHRFGGLRHIPLKLTLWQASNEATGFQPFSLMQLELDAADEVVAMAEAAAARKKLADAGIQDEPDSILAAAGEDEEFGVLPLDYQAVSEFYSQEPTRRNSVTAAAEAANARPARLAQPALASAASSFFESAVRTATPSGAASTGQGVPQHRERAADALP